MIFVGVDPGKAGGVAVVDESGELVQCFPYKPEALLTLVNSTIHKMHFTVEKAQAFPTQGTVSMFNYGKGAGIIEGILIACEQSYDLVAPGRWHSAMIHGAEGDTPKARAWSRCQQLFPNHFHSFMTPRGKVHDGMVDAALIAEFGRRTHNGKESK